MEIDFLKKKESFYLRLNNLVFRFSFLTFAVIFLVEYFLPGFVTNWFNPLWLLLISVITIIIQFSLDKD